MHRMHRTCLDWTPTKLSSRHPVPLIHPIFSQPRLRPHCMLTTRQVNCAMTWACSSATRHSQIFWELILLRRVSLPRRLAFQCPRSRRPTYPRRSFPAPWSWLGRACRRLGLPSTGRKDERLARLISNGKHTREQVQKLVSEYNQGERHPGLERTASRREPSWTKGESYRC
jgi:hypothetical protein